MSKTVCVYSASSEAVDPVYLEAATDLGRQIGDAGWTMIFGGGTIGLMGATARGVHERRGKVIGVIPERLNRRGIAYEEADQVIVTETMRERKAIMDEKADAFIALPGGFGTLEEIIEATTLKQLGYHDRAIVILNTAGFYDPLLKFFEHQIKRKFVKPEHRDLYHIALTPEEAMEYIEGYTAVDLPDKFFEPS